MAKDLDVKINPETLEAKATRLLAEAEKRLKEPGLIYQKIPAVMGDIDAIAKTRRSQQGYSFRGIDDVLSALNPVFVKHRIFVLPEVLDEQRIEKSTKAGSLQFFTVLKVKFTICAEDGSSVYCVMMGEAQDTGDKSAGKAMSIAFKFMGFQVFCIPTEEPEMDTERGAVEPTRANPPGATGAKRQQKPSSTAQPPRPSSPPPNSPPPAAKVVKPLSSQTAPALSSASAEEDDVPDSFEGFDQSRLRLPPEEDRMTRAGDRGIPVETREQIGARLIPLWKEYLAAFPKADPKDLLIQRYRVDDARQLTNENMLDLIAFFTDLLAKVSKGRKR